MMRAISHAFRILALAASTVALVGCYSYHPTTGALPPRSLVRVQFHPSAVMRVRMVGGDTVHLADVTRLEGRMLEARRDTLRLALRSVRSDRELLPSESRGQATANVALTPGRVVEVRQKDQGRSFLAILAAVSTAVLLFIIIGFASSLRRQ